MNKYYEAANVDTDPDEEGVLAKVISSTREAGNLILPFLVPANPVATVPSLRGS